MRYWFVEQQCGLPSWTEVATLLLMLLVPPELRASPTFAPSDTTISPKLTRAFAGFQACLMCSLNLHAALSEPCGSSDFNHLVDGPFFHGLTCRKKFKKIDLGKPPLAEFQQPFDL